MTIGKLFYDALPYIYTATGIVTILTTGETIGTFSGVLLVSAAMLVFHMRLEYRTRLAQSSDETSRISLAMVQSQIH
jgi:hypothetical protein